MLPLDGESNGLNEFWLLLFCCGIRLFLVPFSGKIWFSLFACNLKTKCFNYRFFNRLEGEGYSKYKKNQILIKWKRSELFSVQRFFCLFLWRIFFLRFFFDLMKQYFIREPIKWVKPLGQTEKIFQNFSIVFKKSKLILFLTFCRNLSFTFGMKKKHRFPAKKKIFTCNQMQNLLENIQFRKKMHFSIQFRNSKNLRSEVCHWIFGEAFQRIARGIRRLGSSQPDGGLAGPNESANIVCVRVRQESANRIVFLLTFVWE